MERDGRTTTTAKLEAFKIKITRIQIVNGHYYFYDNKDRYEFHPSLRGLGLEFDLDDELIVQTIKYEYKKQIVDYFKI